MTTAKTQDAPRGIALMIAGVFLFGVMEAMVKTLAQDYEIIQIVWARFLFHFLIFLALFSRSGLIGIGATRRPGLQITRSFLLLTATTFFFFALLYLPLADATSIGFVSPLLVTALAIPFLGEKVGARRWAAIMVGFVGVLIIIRPGMGVMHWAAVLPLGMALCFSCYQILTRIAARSEDARTTQMWSPALGTLVMSAIVPFFWTTPDITGWTLMILIGFAGGMGHYLLIKGYEIAPASTLSPFVYTQLLWMVIFGYVLFGDFPDAFTIAGGCIVIGSGLYIFHREARLPKSIP
jgi:drug/metabolite transporter (DMT)-like permease